MKQKLTNMFRLIIFAVEFTALLAFSIPHANKDVQAGRGLKDDLKRAAFEILSTKCNVCHKKQNPFLVFSIKNMERRASRIYQQVFVKRRMPKGDNTQLTVEEYATLEQWLSTQILK